VELLAWADPHCNETRPARLAPCEHLLARQHLEGRNCPSERSRVRNVFSQFPQSSSWLPPALAARHCASVIASPWRSLRRISWHAASRLPRICAPLHSSAAFAGSRAMSASMERSRSATSSCAAEGAKVATNAIRSRGPIAMSRRTQLARSKFGRRRRGDLDTLRVPYPARCALARRGRRTTNRAPLSGRFSARIVPPCASTFFLQMASPRPVPRSFVV